MRISDWSSDVCSSDLQPDVERHEPDRCAQPHRGYGLLGRDDQTRQGADPVASIDRDARPGEPEPAERPDAVALSKRTAPAPPPFKGAGADRLSRDAGGRKQTPVAFAPPGVC